jgi:hypothetical protein
MRDLIILTDEPITYESINQIIKKEFKSYPLLNDDTHLIYMKKKYSGFELELSPNDILSDPECMMDDTVDRCPNKEAFLTNLSYTSIPIAKRIIKLIINNYGNMWIQSDEADDWFGTAQEFLDNYNEI